MAGRAEMAEIQNPAYQKREALRCGVRTSGGGLITESGILKAGGAAVRRRSKDGIRHTKSGRRCCEMAGRAEMAEIQNPAY